MNLNSPWRTSELDAVRELAAKFCATELAPHRERFAQQHHVDRALWHRAGDLGLLCMSIPVEYGGGGGTFAHEAVLLEEQARIADSSWGAGLHSGIAAHYVLQYAQEELKQRWLPKMASGELIGAIAMTEPGTGSDLQNITTRAVAESDEYVISGSKTFITNGQQADLVIVVAKTDPTQGASGISLIVVEADRPGFRRGNVLNKIGQRGQDTSELFFDAVRVPKSHLLGETEGQGFIQLMTQLPQERLIVAVGAVAAMETALQHTLRYTREREAFGRAVFGFQNTKFTLAEAATETRIARVFLDHCICLHLEGKLDVQTVAMAKWWTTERAMTVIDNCLQLHGGYGYMTDYPISRLWVDQRVQKIYAGTNEIMKEIIARSL
ncbi:MULTISPECIES: acyl-CoA dehydrogenase family protein [Mycobacterium]|nr:MULTISPECIES: acyl-CoA dehydrogenase family protein [Mycobacterium]AFV14800.1 acyl-CoA dehydrogenase [Mycobacterium intracellulare subsp. yongonense 05-1390]BDE17366.1 putative acyl CoA dehydrogenase [Mycobacterium sp. 20KCMC460]GLC22523.1 putative acyl CoA dehydrogenase [Mycobacterium kiyosense]GLC98725.1 putative acyl CoA dehydrogenase [Mycobacterium kiyosense]GLD08669.1 putative acyl CoA dehydrogenase [Mycobacterium kiyosense]